MYKYDLWARKDLDLSMNKEELTFREWLHDTEIKLRGLYLSITVDIDYMLTMLISECFGHNQKEIKKYIKLALKKPKEFHKLTMFERIDVCKLGLEKYHGKAYKEHEHNFVNIDKLRKIRNDFAHNRIDDFISPNDRTRLTINELEANLKVLHTEYEVSKLYEELYEYRLIAQDTIRLIAKVMGKPEPVF